MSILKKEWNAKSYLKQYYTLKKLSKDEILLFKYLISFLKKFPLNHFKNFIDFGSGPTIHRLIPFVPYVKNIYASDYLSENLKEIKTWMKDESKGHEWDPQIKHILELEKKEKNPTVVKLRLSLRKKELKNKVKGLIKCDIFSKKSLSIKKKFDILSSFYCADSIVSSKKEWESAMSNMLYLVKPGGWVVISALRNTSKYKVGDLSFPSANVNEEDMHRALLKNNFDSKTLNVKIIPAFDWVKEDIKSLMVLRAQKKHGTHKRKN